MAEAVHSCLSRAEKSWKNSPIRLRLGLLERFRHRLVERRSEVLQHLARVRSNSSRAELQASELLPLLDACRFLEREASQALRPKNLGRWGQPAWLWGVETTIYREALGRVLIIGPGNYPLFLPLVQALAAWAAGNSVHLQSAPGTLDLHEFVHQVFCSVGGPPEVFQLLGESHEVTSTALAEGVHKVVLVGSVETGRKLLPLVTETLVPTVAELSGWDSVFVHPEAEADLVGRAVAFGLSLNGGKTCVAPRRIFFRGDPTDFETCFQTSLSTRPSVLLTEEERSLIAAEVSQGARAFQPDPGSLERGPVLLSRVGAHCPLLKTPHFGSLAVLRVVEDDQQALAEARKCSMALGSSLFGPRDWAETLVHEVPAQMVTVNDLIVPSADPRVPFGGAQASGYGRMRGLEGLLEMTQTRVVSRRVGGSMDHLAPPSDLDETILDSFLALSHSASACVRFRAFWGMFVAIGKERIKKRLRARGWIPGPAEGVDRSGNG